MDNQEIGLSILDIDKQSFQPILRSKEEIIASIRMGWCNQQDILWAKSKRSIVLLQIKETNFQQYLPNKSLRGIRVFDNNLFVQKFKIPLDEPNKLEERDGIKSGICAEPNRLV